MPNSSSRAKAPPPKIRTLALVGVAASVAVLAGCPQFGTKNGSGSTQGPTPLASSAPSSVTLKFTAAANFSVGAPFVAGKPLVSNNGSALLGGIVGYQRQNLPMSHDRRVESNYAHLYLAPSRYSIALKSLKLALQTNTLPIPFTLYTFFDSQHLRDSKILAFDPASSSVDIGTASLPVGTYLGALVEVYYLQCIIPVDGSNQWVRVYLTDDDFPDQVPQVGSGAHHQGDVTFLDDSGKELGWVHTGIFSPLAPRPVPATGQQFYASSPDSKYHHDRGPFGNDSLWNHPFWLTPLTADVPFPVAQMFDSPVGLNQANAQMKLNLDVQHAWEYDDVNGDSKWEPTCGPGVSCDATPDATWAPDLPLFKFSAGP